MTIDSEEIVQLALNAYDKSFVDERNRTHFELELRRVLMQRHMSSKSFTYTITPGTTMGTWAVPCGGGTGTPPAQKTLITG